MKTIRFTVMLIFILAIQVAHSQSSDAVQEQSSFKNEAVSKNPLSIPNLLFSGILLRKQEKNQVWYIPNAFEWFPANTVEGFVINPQVKFTQNYKDGRFFSLMPNLRYGFGNERFQAQLESEYFYQPEKMALLSLSGGRSIDQLYHDATLSALNNTLYTFSFEENFLKIYERSYVDLSHMFSPIRDFLLVTSLNYENRQPLENLPKYESDGNFTSNAPENIELENTAFQNHNALLFTAQVRWQKGHRLERKRGQLISRGKYPALMLSYIHATDGVLGGDVSYQKLAFSVEDEFKISKNSFGKAFVEFGDFLSQDALTFLDFKHFKGKEIVYGPYGIDQFQLLEYYRNSTASFYLQGHYEHYFPPLYSKNGEDQFRPVAGSHYLYTQEAGHYAEFGLGIDKILGLWRLDFYGSWREWRYERFGVRLGLSFD